MGKNIFTFDGKNYIKNCNEDCDKRYIFKVDDEYPKQLLHNPHNNLPFLPEKLTVHKCQKLCKCVAHIKISKHAVNNVHKVIKSNQKCGWKHLLI